MTTVTERKARATGTYVALVDNRDGSFDCCDSNGWFTVCVDHGNVCSHETRQLAAAWLSHPEEWCSECQS